MPAEWSYRGPGRTPSRDAVEATRGPLLLEFGSPT
jgi:hypothetical protein